MPRFSVCNRDSHLFLSSNAHQQNDQLDACPLDPRTSFVGSGSVGVDVADCASGRPGFVRRQ